MLESLGEDGLALKQYADLVEKYSGEEVRCRYALLLKKNGHVEKAQKIYREAILRFKRAPRFYKREQKEWMDILDRNFG